MFQKFKYALFALAVSVASLAVSITPAEAAGVKLSAIASGGAVAASTDQMVGVRSGTTDVLLTVGSSCVENLTSIVADNGAGGLTLGAGQVTNAMLANSSMTLAGHSVALGGTQTFACGDLSNGATGCSTTVGTSATVNTGTSGATIPLNNGNNTTSGNDIYSGTMAVTNTSTPTQAGGTLGLAGTATAPTLGANSEGDVFLTSAAGLNLIGQGSSNDFTLLNKSGTSVCTVATGTTNYNCTGLQVGGTAVLTGNQSITLSSDVTGSGTTAITTTIANNAVTNAKAAQGGANTMKGNWTGSTANEADNSMPSCSDSGGNHLNYVSGTGITCGTTDSHAGTVTSIATTAPITGGTITSTGTIACATCATTTNGGAISGTAPVVVSAAGAISITGAANQVLAGAGPAFTATPTIGTSVTTPLVIGGTAASSTLTLESTSGSGTTDSIVFKTGSQVTAMTIGTSQTTTLAAAGIDAQSTPAISTATFTPNFAAANHFIVNLVHASCPCTLANPTNIVAGQSGVIALVQSATGSDLINTYGTDFIFTNTSSPTLSTAANSIDYLSYYVEDATHIRAAYIPANPQSVNAGGLISNQTKFTTSGCSVSSTTGGATAGKYTSGTTGTCTVTVTMNGATGLASPNGWSCWANDETTPADKQQTTSSTTTTAVIAGTTVSGDVVDFGCVGF